MGQYHTLVNIDKKEVVVPHALGLGLKQWEHAGHEGGSLADALYILMMTSPAAGGGDFPETDVSGRWVGDRVLVLGDYTEKNAVPGVEDASLINADESYTDIGDQVAEAMGSIFGWSVEGTGWKSRVPTVRTDA